MKVTAPPGGWRLEGPAGQPARATLALHFETAGAGRILIDAGAAMLTGVFEPLELWRGPRWPLGLSLELGGRAFPWAGPRSYPTTPRLGIEDPAGTSGFEPVWLAAGEIGKDPPPAPQAEAGEVDAGRILGETLGRHLQRRLDRLLADGQPVPATLEVTLAAESDAPCRFVLERLEVPYRLAAARLPAAEGAEPKEKEVLRFPGGSVKERGVAAPLPRQARVTNASLRVSDGLRGGRAAGDGGFPAPAGKTGIQLGTDLWAGQPLMPEAPLTADGVALAVLPLAVGTEILFALEEDADGLPSGRALAEGSIRLGEAGRPLWCTARLARPLPLSAGPCWLLVKAATGRAVWLADPQPSGLLLLARSTPRDRWRVEGGLPGHTARHRLLAATADGPLTSSAFTLAVGGSELSPAVQADGVVTYDLTAPLNAWLATAPADIDEAAAPLTFASAGEGTLTVYPPEIEYEIE